MSKIEGTSYRSCDQCESYQFTTTSCSECDDDLCSNCDVSSDEEESICDKCKADKDDDDEK